MKDDCPNCKRLAVMVKELHTMLMGFHTAGASIASHQLEMAKADVLKTQADAELARTQTAYIRANAASIGEVAGPPPKHGGTGHQRTRISPGPDEKIT